MGLFSRKRSEALGLQHLVKQSKEMRKQMESMIDQTGDIGQQVAYGKRIMRLNQHGKEGTAIVRAVRERGTAPGGRGIELELDLTMTSGPGAPREVTARQAI